MRPPSLPRVAVLAALVLFSPTTARGGPDVLTEREPVAGLLCYWICYAACMLAGKRGDQCDAVCTDSCFTIVAVVSEPEPVCG
jgi:hypothetical protein